VVVVNELAERFTGALGGEFDDVVTEFDELDDCPITFALLVAYTVNVYAVLDVNPYTMIVVPEPVAEKLPGLLVTV
jgi:hypothetical protein